MRENSTKLPPDSSNIQGGKAKPEPELRQREIVRDSESSHVGFYIAKASPRRNPTHASDFVGTACS